MIAIALSACSSGGLKGTGQDSGADGPVGTTDDRFEALAVPDGPTGAEATAERAGDVPGEAVIPFVSDSGVVDESQPPTDIATPDLPASDVASAADRLDERGGSVDTSAISLTIAPTQLDLGGVLVGTTGVPASLTVTNVGASAAGPLDVALSGEAVLIADRCTRATLAPGASCSFAVALKPVSAGNKSVSVMVLCNGSVGATKTGEGSAIADVVPTVTPTSIDFGAVAVGAVAGPRSVTVSNTGSLATAAPTLSVRGDSFSVDAGTCNQPIPPGASCTFRVFFVPTTAGSHSGVVTLNDGTTSSNVTLAGIGQAGAAFSVMPSSIDLGRLMVGASVKQTITVTAGSFLTDLTISVSGSDLKVDPATTCTSALAAATSCTVVVSFAAVTAGAKSDTVVVSAGGASGKTVVVPISATATMPAALVMIPTSAAFSAEVGTASSPVTFAIANTGDVSSGPLSVVITGTNASDFASTANCLLLAPLATCMVTVTFHPTDTATTSRSATLSVSDSGPGGTSVSAALRGSVYFSAGMAISRKPAGSM